MLPAVLVVLAVALLTACTGSGTDEDGSPASGAVPVADAPLPDDVSSPVRRACADLLRALPDALLDQPRREVEPADALAAAWGDPVLVLRCGVDQPEGLTRTSECVTVDGVDWFFAGDELVDPEGPEVTFSAIKRRAVVEVVEPVSYGPPAELLADLSAAVRRTVPRTGTCL